jgi:pseudaminic acid cytidylyltransferase
MASNAIAVIPARGGSTRIPRKNIAAFNGKPMISWAIEAALATPAISRVVVSTDDEEIAQVARDHGAEVPFIRPAELATHSAGTAPVIQHAIAELGVGDGVRVMCVYPTAALPSEIFADAIAHSEGVTDQFVISVGRHRSPLERALVQSEDGLMALAHPAHLMTRTQDLPSRFFDAGKLYIALASLWSAAGTMMAKPFVPYFLPEWASVDIDEPEDWPVAEALHRVFVTDYPA